jgi:xylan 1,4-beta-xylosidase
VWNYHDDDVAVPATPVDLVIRGVAPNTQRVAVEHFRVDADHSNSYAQWKRMGEPQSLNQPEQEKIQAAGQLQLMGSPMWESVKDGSIQLQFSLPRQGLSLIRIFW